MIHMNNDMNINIHIDMNMNIDITPPHPHPMLGPSADGAGGEHGVGVGGGGDARIPQPVGTFHNQTVHSTTSGIRGWAAGPKNHGNLFHFQSVPVPIFPGTDFSSFKRFK